MCYCPYLCSLQWIIVSVWLHCPLHIYISFFSVCISFLYPLFLVLFFNYQKSLMNAPIHHCPPLLLMFMCFMFLSFLSIIVSVQLHCPLHCTYCTYHSSFLLYAPFSILVVSHIINSLLFLSCFSITRTHEFNECTNSSSSFITYIHVLLVLVICSPFPSSFWPFCFSLVFVVRVCCAPTFFCCAPDFCGSFLL